MINRRVVITGLGVVAPNSVGVTNFTNAIKNGKSGITFQQKLRSLNFRCQVAGVPPLTDQQISEFCQEHKLKKLQSTGILYGCMAGIEAWADARLPIPAKDEDPDGESGCIFGSGMTGMEPISSSIPLIDQGLCRKMGGRIVQQVMSSGISAYLGGLLGLGNQVTTNSSACATGTEATIMAFERIKMGWASRMLVGGCDSCSEYVWGGFDAMRVLTNEYHDEPEKASRPMSATAVGFVPGAGSGGLVLEELESARARGAKIYAELLGGAINSGGQRKSGSMTAPNTESVIQCITTVLQRSSISGHNVDAVSGHLTSTRADSLEIKALSEALGRKHNNFPYINSLKSMTGHCLSAAGAIENVAAVKQLEEGFFHASLNCEDLHPAIEAIVARDKIPRSTLENTRFRILLKTSFGFGDVNSCLVLKKWDE